MLNYEKEIKNLEKEIAILKENVELVKNFDSFDLIKRFEIAKKTGLRYQRVPLTENLMKDFKSEAIRNCDVATMGVNEFTIRVDYIDIIIPLYNSKLIKIKDNSKHRLVKTEFKDTSFEEKFIKNIEDKISKLSIFRFNERRVQKIILKRKKIQLENLVKLNKRIEEENKIIDEKIIKDKEIISSIQEDIDMFKENGYDFKFEMARFLNK